MMRIFAGSLVWLAAGICIAQVPAPVVPAAPASAEMVQRLKLLETELRCLVCQNQTLADSPAGLADDLRREIRELADAGKSNAEIKTFLQQRYGDFILYKPPVKPTTVLLWAGPFLLLLLGGVSFALIVRRRAGAGGEQGAETSAGERDKARKLLEEDRPRDPPG